MSGVTTTLSNVGANVTRLSTAPDGYSREGSSPFHTCNPPRQVRYVPPAGWLRSGGGVGSFAERGSRRGHGGEGSRRLRVYARSKISAENLSGLTAMASP